MELSMVAFGLGVAGLVVGLVLGSYLARRPADAGGAERQAADDATLAALARVAELEAAVADAEARAAEATDALAALEITGPEAQLSAAEVEALLDPVTGLYGESFFAITLSSRVAAARRHLRPVAIVLIEVAAGVRDGHPMVADVAMVSRHVRTTLREADTACRLDNNRFALVLEDTPENGAVWTVERVRRALATERSDLTLWAGVACYPAHAFDGDELFARATAALDAAKEWRQDRIEVATTSEV